MKNRSARADQVQATMRNDSATDGKDLIVQGETALSPVDMVRQAIAKAAEEGDPRPGRPTLIRATGLTGHQVLKALKELAAEDDQQESTTVDSGDRWQMLRQTWPLIVIGLAAAVAVWSGWVGLGKLAGFGMIQPLPGIVDSLHIDSSMVLPVSVEAYAAYALRCWLSVGRFSPRTIRFAKWSSIGSLSIGAGAQVAYHVMAAAGVTRAPWWITTLVACVPVVVLGLASALAKMVSGDRHQVARVDEADVR